MAQEEIIFPNNIRKIRLSRGMKMTELAKKSGLSLSAVSKIEKGVRRLNQKQLLTVCNILSCKLSDIFIKESDEVASKWQNEIRRRMAINEDNGLKIFGIGLRKLRQMAGKTIAQAAKDARLTLSIYHKIEVGQREIYQSEIEPLAKSFACTVESLFDKIANLYKSGALNKQMNKIKESVKSVLVPRMPVSSLDAGGSLYGAKLYDKARKKLIPVFGKPSDKAIHFKKSDEIMINAPAALQGRKSIYAVIPNSKRLGGFIPEKSYVFANADIAPAVGDLAVFLDKKFESLSSSDIAVAQIAVVRRDPKGKLFGQITSPEEKVVWQTMHKVVMVVMQ